MLELTLQEARDALIRDHALRRCGRNSALLKRLFPRPGMYRMAMATPGHTEEPLEPISVEGAHASTTSEDDLVNAVGSELERLDHEFWHRAALEFDRKKNGEKTVLNFIGEIPEDPHQTRVTTTSLSKFVQGILGQDDSQTKRAPGTREAPFHQDCIDEPATESSERPPATNLACATQDAAALQESNPATASSQRRWEDLDIRFYRGNEVAFFFNGQPTPRIKYSDTVLFNKTQKKLSVKGAMLLGLAIAGEIKLPREDKTRRKNIASYVSKIGGWLRNATGITTSPFVTKEHSYEPRFRVTDKRDDAQNRFEKSMHGSESDVPDRTTSLDQLIEDQNLDREHDERASIDWPSDDEPDYI